MGGTWPSLIPNCFGDVADRTRTCAPWSSSSQAADLGVCRCTRPPRTARADVAGPRAAGECRPRRLRSRRGAGGSVASPAVARPAGPPPRVDDDRAVALTTLVGERVQELCQGQRRPQLPLANLGRRLAAHREVGVEQPGSIASKCRANRSAQPRKIPYGRSRRSLPQRA